MLKKVVVIVISMFVVAGTAYAGSLWGSYKGYPIIKITSNGKTINMPDVPAISMEGRPLVPVSLLKEIGVKADFDANKQTVDVKVPQNNLSVTELNKRFDSIGALVAYNELGNVITEGTAFFTNGFVVTNYRFLLLAESFKVYVSNTGKNIEFGNLDEIVAFSDPGVSLIGFPYETDNSLSISTKKPQKGDRVYSIWNEMNGLKIREGVILSVELDGSFNHSAENDSGEGSVILDEEGNLIGVTGVWSLFDEDKWKKVIPVQKLENLMKNANKFNKEKK
ncbi:hypothetical protein [Paenibacillus fonticola]|uniref:hypothetical protein n=1 Tax=Paenibacillus fonticola TaxID=379896 RepID=UPI00036A71F9|nr:hypothetical protein [Paenibacillus fonticola]